ncbi:MAG: S9 family peptidase, partial [Acidobacteriota bacterium]|nr:S9 family peptidase [Acidobacteriota bacterium]
MKRFTLTLALLLFAVAAAGQRGLTFQDLVSIHRIGAPQISPDGQWLAYDVSTPDLAANRSFSAVYVMPSAGGTPKLISDAKHQDNGPVWSPDGKTIAYVSNRDGGAHQVWLYDVAGGTSRKVSDLAGGAGSVKWMPDGSGLVVVSDIYPDCGVDPACIKNKATAEAAPTKARVLTGLLYRHWKAWQEPTRSHIVYVPLNGGTPRDLTPGAFDAPPFSIGSGDEFDVSPDGRELVYARDTEEHPEVSTNSDLFLVPIGGGDSKRITTRGGADTGPKYSPDGRWIAWRSQARAGYESDLFELWLYDRTNGKTQRIAPAFDDWAESITWAPDSKSIYFIAPAKSRNVIYEVGIDGGAPRFVYGAGSVDAVTVSRDGKTLYFDQSSLNHPADIYAMTKITGGTRAVALTHENDALFSTLSRSSEDYWYTGAEGAKVQALIVRPPNFDRTKKYPAIVLIHGGPQGAWSDAWSYRWNPQIFAARGYVVFMPNPRGSTGYGQKFVEEISGDWGGKAYVDIMNGVDQLAAMPFVDGTRIGAAGGSYGGYMVDWILGHTDRFKALVSHAGVYDLKSEYGVTEELWFPEWEFKGNPWDNPELYQRWSPDNFVKNFKTPTLVTHGELDFRVPINQGLELFTALQRRGIPSKMLYFPDEGHWVLKPQNS